MIKEQSAMVFSDTTVNGGGCNRSVGLHLQLNVSSAFQCSAFNRVDLKTRLFHITYFHLKYIASAAAIKSSICGTLPTS